MINLSKQVLKEQKKRMAALVAALGAVVVGLTMYGFGEGKELAPVVRERKADIPGDKQDVQEIWMTQMEIERQVMSKKIDYLESLVLDSKKREEGLDSENSELRRQIFSLRQDLESQSLKRQMGTQNDQVTQGEYLTDPFDPQPLVGFEQAQVRDLSITEMDGADSLERSNVREIIPAGTTVKAVIVSGVNASTGVNAMANPSPVKLRILDDGHLTSDVDVSLKGGIVLGSAYADISGERVQIRLERMTIVKPSGDFVETDVVGFVSGEDGVYGLRGTVVDRSDKLIKSAAFAGFFAGVSDFVAGMNGQRFHYSFEESSQDWRTGMFKEGAFRGSSEAMDRLSEYYLKRAEQLSPVIQVGAGRVVTITFHHGVEIGGLNTKEKLGKLRTKSRLEEGKSKRGGGNVS